MELTIGRTLMTTAHTYGGLEAIVIDEKRVTFAELDEAVNRRANALLELGVNRGDHVGTLFANCLEVVETIYAIVRIGAVVVPLNFRLSAEELVYIMDHADISTLVFQDDFEDVVREIQNSVTRVKTFLYSGQGESPDFENFEASTRGQSAEMPVIDVKENDIATIIYTSGTTGRPKGVVHTHKSWLWETANLGIVFGSRFEKSLTVYPLFHSAGIVGLFGSVFGANTAFMLKGFDPKLMLETIEKEGIEVLGNPPTAYKMLLMMPELKTTDVSSIRKLMSGSESIPDETRNQLKKAFPGAAIIENYGMTETCSGLTNRSGEFSDTKPMSVGRPLPHSMVRVVDEEGNDTAPEEVGEIICTGPNIMQGYYKDPEKTADAIRDGWLYTGDMGKLDSDGFLYIMERKNHMIISGGENIYPKEVEEVLYRHPKIQEAAVFGATDETYGQKVCTAIVTQPGEKLESEEVVDFCKENLASFKKPKAVYFVDALPKNIMGKILRSELQKQYPD
ncbi:MAG: long-chain-fatty-acid--CoA ligase [Deltaproteobacteria bacterium]|jgi:fatty-acyl-CoA synthase|nr:long-chain-fatty-acid--CoA ligase [Deltaproteobacteria bacterium]MBT4643585.1 long-chain-fatty-acid--CoA ligase [Deltaproteobacteria bacterium]MBT6498383.1 long-chain-fatty-acid--CoA ligase [Deltaproteobacteria bacterium]MBT7154268.1 long-chain-fatty-acid--CoA ligase [Deltaproteobacteria bacterium]MBT7711030.1 long-chain-fatty-acid--CoA ligase [Deltaproteobacteria bacterium]